MKIRNFKKVGLLALCTGIFLYSCQPEEDLQIATQDTLEFIGYENGDVIPGKYIVVLNPTSINFRKGADYASNQANMRKISSDLLSKYRIEESNLEHVYGSSVEGFSVSLSDEEFAVLSKDPAVKFVEPDRVVMLAPPPGKGPNRGGDGGGGTGPAQETPWGITRVNGGTSYTGSNKAYIIDSGIDSSHPDLKVDVSLGFNAFSSGRDSNLSSDGNGHGTHVAGTVAAIDNTIGVIGVAAGATVVPVKVLDRRGSGSFSGVIAGVDFVAANANPGDVANMSLGGGFSQTLNNAVIAMANAGIKVALAAGNESTNASTRSPASANGNNIYTISAMDSNDRLASFSNFGNPPVDYAAPGVGVLSTVPGGGYASYNGTSMASPHVAGLLLLGNISSDGTISGDRDNTPDPIATR